MVAELDTDQNDAPSSPGALGGGSHELYRVRKIVGLAGVGQTQGLYRGLAVLTARCNDS